MTIKNAKLRKAMDRAGLDSVQLEKANGHFWLWSDDEEVNNTLLSADHTGIYVYKLTDLTVDEWVDEIKAILDNGARRMVEFACFDLADEIRVRG